MVCRFSTLCHHTYYGLCSSPFCMVVFPIFFFFAVFLFLCVHISFVCYNFVATFVNTTALDGVVMWHLTKTQQKKMKRKRSKKIPQPMNTCQVVLIRFNSKCKRSAIGGRQSCGIYDIFFFSLFALLCFLHLWHSIFTSLFLSHFLSLGRFIILYFLLFHSAVAYCQLRVLFGVYSKIRWKFMWNRCYQNMKKKMLKNIIVYFYIWLKQKCFFFWLCG